MERFFRHSKLVKSIMILLLFAIASIFVVDILYINKFNSKVHSADGAVESEDVYMTIKSRTDDASSWVKKDFNLNSKLVNLDAQIYDGTVNNNSDYDIKEWSFTLQVKGDCYINNAWCGTVEIHQNVGTADEKVQTIDLRNYNVKDIILDYRDDGDLLIPLKAGDYVVYNRSLTYSDNEVPILENATKTMGFILYYLDQPDLTSYTLNYQYDREYTDCGLFTAFVVCLIIWVFVVDAFTFIHIAYKAALREMEIKKSSISAMSDIYSDIYIVDLNKNEIIPVNVDGEYDSPIHSSANKQLKSMFERDCVEMYKHVVEDFCNLDTIRERIGSRTTIVCEYVSKKNGWCQLRFAVMERGEHNAIEKLIFTTQIINDEKLQLESLNLAVEKQSEHIIDMQQKIVVGLANIIENRDNSTGGHVKRTSDVMGILVNEIQTEGAIPMDEVLANDIVRAAPMHDLGKISIDSSILCKPARLTDEEFAIMKTHSTKSGEMVKLLLDGVEEEHFVNTAFNIARFHHERWDGKGYPENRQGNDIPFEARLMAIADVYDALVSKRCYKEPMSFEQAYDIMMEGMGTQFDPRFKEVFRRCRKALEEYYTNNR